MRYTITLRDRANFAMERHTVEASGILTALFTHKPGHRFTSVSLKHGILSAKDDAFTYTVEVA